MTKGQIAIGILMFAMVTAVLYIWGLRKSVMQGQDLTRTLLNRCGNKVVKYLKKNGTITEKEIAHQIEGVKAGEFWSKNRIVVQDPKKFVNEVVTFLIRQQYIETAGKDGYRLKK